MSYHTCPRCGEEDGIEMKMDTPAEPDVNAGATYTVDRMNCACSVDDLTADQWDALERSAAEADADWEPSW